MLTNRFVKSTGLAFSAIFLAAVPVVSGGILAGAGAEAGTTGRVTADHGWGKTGGVAPATADGFVVLAAGAGDHGWG